MRLFRPITLGELKTAIEKGSKNKTQRADGVVYEFYVHFGYVIERNHLIIYNSILRNRDLVLTQTLEWVVFMPKC